MNEIAVVKSQLKLESWAEMIRNCRASGLTVNQWCDENGINPKTYYYRLKKVRMAALDSLGDRSESNLQPVFGKLQVPPATTQSSITVHLPYATLEITESATDRTIQAVLAALKSIC